MYIADILSFLFSFEYIRASGTDLITVVSSRMLRWVQSPTTGA